MVLSANQRLHEQHERASVGRANRRRRADQPVRHPGRRVRHRRRRRRGHRGLVGGVLRQVGGQCSPSLVRFPLLLSVTHCVSVFSLLSSSLCVSVCECVCVCVCLCHPDSVVVRAFAHGAMGRRIDPSWLTH